MTLYESLPGYCKYMSDADAVMQGVFEKRTIRFTQPSALNDPLDCNPVLKVPSAGGEQSMYRVAGILMPSENLWFYIQLVHSNMSYYGVLSLTKNPVGPDMWSMYANGHRGFLLEFSHDFNTHSAFLASDGTAYAVRQVEYVKKFMIDIGECLDESSQLDHDKFKDLLFYQKSKRWKREKEYRLVRSLVDLGKESGGVRVGVKDDPRVYVGELPLSVINSVTFGAKMEPEKKAWIIDKCKGTNIQFMQSMVFPLRYDDKGLSPQIRLMPLDDPAVLKKVLPMNPLLLLRADENLLGHEDINVKEINELPYYQGYEKLVEMMFESRKRSSGL